MYILMSLYKLAIVKLTGTVKFGLGMYASMTYGHETAKAVQENV